jgi:integrase
LYGKIEVQLNKLIGVSELVKFNAKHTSKHEARNVAASEIKEEGKKASRHEIALKTGVFNNGTYDNYYATMRELGRFMVQNNCKDLEKLSNNMVEKFLLTKIEKGVTYETYQNICSVITKIEGALNIFADKFDSDKKYCFDKAKNFLADKANEDLEKGYEARSYEKPKEIINGLQNERYQMVASIQYEGGARINEASLIDEKRLGGIIERDGKEYGVIALQRGDSKGGDPRDLYISKETYNRVAAYVAENGKLHIQRGSERQEYRNAIKAVAEETGQRYGGSHGFRHNFAQERVAELQEAGHGYSVALTMVSQEMGHYREDITEHYLRS